VVTAVGRGEVRQQADVGRRLLREVEGIFAAAGALFLALSFVSYEPVVPGGNLGGPVGHATADLLVGALGLGGYLIPLYLGVLTWHLFREDGPAVPVAKVAGCAVLVLAVATACALASGGGAAVSAAPLGGWLGGFLAAELRAFLGTSGAVIVTAALLVLSLLLATGTSLLVLVEGARRGAADLTRAAAERSRAWWRARWAPEAEVPEGRRRGARGRDGAPSILVTAPVADFRPPPITIEAPGSPKEPREPKERDRARRERGAAQAELPFAGADSYVLPEPSVLDPPVHGAVKVDEEALIASSRILETKLADFGVQGKVVAVRPGPVITTFELEPAPGIKVNRIVTLADDLAMALRAVSVRILAPIPGKPVVGIEVSNPRRDKVFIRELIESEEFRHAESHLTIALGKDTTGHSVMADLARMPHLLVAGATGTGKSVSINAMILSILFRCSPRDVRFIMIDPKMLELSIYEDVPHLLVPVVTDPKRAAAALANIMREMDYRYRLLHDKGVRSIDSYNRLLAREAEDRRSGVVELTESEADEPQEWAAEPPDDGLRATDAADERPLVHQHLPHVVIIIDELADLMMTVGREIEESITRLAQKARAAGIHLILATQRPSVDVITGLIKANFPARVSFQVTSRTDSRTILDAIGAERLLGEGDMLYLPPGTARVRRIHGSFVSDGDVRRVVDFIKRQEKPSYRMELLKADEAEAGGAEEDEPYDEMYDEAVRLVTETGQASISWVQRRLRVGYNRAARMIERMERDGVVSSSEGGRPREVLARRIDG
jgi:S-DNA-T family DNA segregation ATPase FtsK/SpoIIIE